MIANLGANNQDRLEGEIIEKTIELVQFSQAALLC